MYHPKNRKPFSLDVKFNVKKQRYETVENGILYAFDFGLLESLKKYFRNNEESVEAWFAQLPGDEKKQVIRLGLPDDLESYNDGNFIE